MTSRKRTTANLDWKNLPFGYVKTNANIRYYWRDGVWSEGEVVSDENISISVAAPCIHYGQQAFEGLKVFETKSGEIVAFRPEENAMRLNRSCERIFMPAIPEKLFVDAIHRVVAANVEFVPPYGTGASLYVRPLIIGVGPRVGLGPAEEYIFIVLVSPVGPYYKGGFKPVEALVVEQFDRAAPLGVGDCKVGGNYAAGLAGSEYGKKHGFPIVLFLDPREKVYLDEFGTSNVVAIHGDAYVTPKSPSILPSITNRSLAVIAEDLGMRVEWRQIAIDEVQYFSEIGAVGTAAVITPVYRIRYRDRDFTFGKPDVAGPMLTKLYEQLTGIQYGEIEDRHGWLDVIEV
ncbi:MAG TPA: branched-chain amino acid aminotransferase [Spirochaetota bacterium]|nr:branched-chain amino acid aminotransferase [Spirochaetota bacterium]HPU87020.1 branched-chain amino acid aminotransferase [Spirochaetota bacterium]